MLPEKIFQLRQQALRNRGVIADGDAGVGLGRRDLCRLAGPSVGRQEIVFRGRHDAASLLSPRANFRDFAGKLGIA
jgi:hypothetical protein